MNIPKYLDLYRKDLMLKNYAETSIENYVSQVKQFLYTKESEFTEPSKINEQSIKYWLLESKSTNGRKHRISALKLFYKLTIGQPMKLKSIEYPRSDKKLPIVLSVDEVQRMFNICENKKHKVILALLYSCGLRVSELINLKKEHIDYSRKIINVIQAKGNKDRQVMLTDSIIPLLEKYYTEYNPNQYILNGQNSLRYSERSVGEVVKQLALKAGIENKRIYTHLMRHTSATHMVENGIDINLIQKLLGHSNVKTTNIYTHISHNLISKIQSPLQSIRI
jgi:integrase/recombinase XerD